MDKTKVKKILVIGLSNIGDAILTTPVIEVLRENFPQAQLDLLSSQRASVVFKSDIRIDKKIIYDKSISWIEKLKLINRLKQDRYDLAVDLRQTAFNIFLGARYHTSIFARAPKSLMHMKDRHLWKLKSLGLDISNVMSPSVMFGKDERNYINNLFNSWQIKEEDIVIALSPGARNMTKRWEKEGYRQLVEQLIKNYNTKIIMLGDDEDRVLAQEIARPFKTLGVFQAAGVTTISQLAHLLTRCRLLVSNDSAVMHLGWAVNTPVVAIFGPTSHEKYAPQGAHDIVVRKELDCSPCEESLCPEGQRQCMKSISAEEVFLACRKILNGKR
ncbi:MAG: lipopolysaccharide heptosyltransferase II [Candidatus Omnitrophota bacterium]|nr:MAG: lipopolysaccharide heptosyltransferase II [Candidatus Omnitrophota bacterium]